MIYVTVTDTFMSGWGEAKGKENILIFECETEEEADIVYENCKNRNDFEDVGMYFDDYPYFDSEIFYVQHKDRIIYPCYYEEGYFTK